MGFCTPKSNKYKIFCYSTTVLDISTKKKGMIWDPFFKKTKKKKIVIKIIQHLFLLFSVYKCNNKTLRFPVQIITILFRSFSSLFDNSSVRKIKKKYIDL